ncbi:MAG: alpha/beta fold hydrolase [Pseudomonadota bacterium]
MTGLNFVIEGKGPMVVLSHALGCDLHMWDEVAALLTPHYTVLRYDHRGHGRSPAEEGAFSMNDLADDAAELIRAHATGPVHFAGLSMGGMTAQALGARHPSLVKSLVIANSASHYDAAARAGWMTRISTVQAGGMKAISEGAIQRWFTPAFRADAHGKQRVAVMQSQLEATAPGPYAASCLAVATIDLERGNASIACPTLVIAGDLDEATPPALSEVIAKSIPGAALASIGAAHLSAVERPGEFAQLVGIFWAAQQAA